MILDTITFEVLSLRVESPSTPLSASLFIPLATRTTYISACGSSLSSNATMAVPCLPKSSSMGSFDSPRQSNQCPSKRSAWPSPGPEKNVCSTSQPVSRTATRKALVPFAREALSDKLTKSKQFSHDSLSRICLFAKLTFAYADWRSHVLFL